MNNWNSNSEPLSIVMHYDGEKYNRIISSNEKYLNTVWGKSSDLVFFGGSQGKSEIGDPMINLDITIWDGKENRSTSFDSGIEKCYPRGIIKGFASKQNEKTIYAYTNEGYIYQANLK